MTRTTQRNAAILLAVAGTWMIIRYGLIPPSIGWPHWLHHVLTAPAAWMLAAGAWFLTRSGGRLYRIAATLFAIWATVETLLSVVTVVWEGVLQRGPIPSGLHAVELVLFLAYIAALLLGIGLIRRRGVTRWTGAALVAALVIDAAGVPWAAGAGILCAAAGLLAASASQPIRESVTAT